MKLPVSHLMPGMVLESPVYSNRGELLLNSGRVLNHKYIRALKKTGILAVNVTLDARTAQRLDIDLVKAKNALTSEIKMETYNSIKSFIENRMTSEGFASVVNSVENIISEIISDKIPVGGLAEITSYDSYTYAHCVDVCALAVAIGHHLGLSRRELLDLGIGSILHDLGKTRISTEIINKPGRLDDEEFEEIKKHTVHGYRIACFEIEDDIAPEAAEIILNHHERLDGSGYPRSLKKSQISRLDMICGIADMYNAMTTDRIYRKALPYNEVYEMLMGSVGTYFRLDVVEAFARCVDPYPVGTFVKLDNEQKACVVRLNPGMPFRPVIKIVSTKEYVDLKENLSLVIKSQLPPDEIKELMSVG